MTASQPLDPQSADPQSAGATRPLRRLRWSAALPLLPVLALAWPLPALLALDPYPARTAAGAGLLLTLPAVFFLTWRRSLELPRAILWLTPPLGFGILGLGVTDDSEHLRAVVTLATAVLAFACGSTLSERARELFAIGTMALSLLFAGSALIGHAFGGEAGLAGTLGNTGSLSQAALPGAAVALTWGLRRAGPVRALAGASLVAFALHALLAPVIAGAVALAAAALTWTRRAPRKAAALPAWGLPLALVLALPALGPALGTDDTAAGAARPTDATGGFAVRRKLWATAPSLVAEHPWTGLGPGQFQAAYPPYRDAEEIELSTHGRLLGEEIVVEHLHNDWLQGFAEWGVLGGGAWCLFLVLIAAGALSRHRASAADPARGPALALLVGALFHAPLLANPAASIQAFLFFGMVAAGAGRERLLRPRWSWELSALALLAALPALLLFISGRDLVHRPPEPGERERYARSVATSLDILPSAEGHAILARWHTAHGVQPLWGGTPEEHWNAVLEMRPHQTEALLNAGVLRVRGGDAGGARELWQRVLAVDARHPRALRNLARLELSAGRPDVALQHLLQLREDGRLTHEFTLELATNELLRLHTGPALALLYLGDGEDLAEAPAARPELLHALADEHPDDERLADALRMTAQRLWGHQHAGADNGRQAAISLRQAHALARKLEAPGSNTIGLELAAAEHLAGYPERARDLLATIRLETVDWSTVAPFATAPLEELGAR